MQALVADLEEKVAAIKLGGGEKARAKHAGRDNAQRAGRGGGLGPRRSGVRLSPGPAGV